MNGSERGEQLAMTTKMTNGDGGAPALRGLVRAGLATPAQERLYFEQVVRPAWDARHSAEGEALDLTAHDLVGVRTTKKEGAMGEQLYERFLREQNAKTGTTTGTTTADLSEEDAAFERFAAESGLNALTGRTPGAHEAADLAAPASDDATIGAAGSDLSHVGDAAMWSEFCAVTGFEDAAPAEVASDLSEDGDDGAGKEGSSLSDEEAWAQYQAALGQP